MECTTLRTALCRLIIHSYYRQVIHNLKSEYLRYSLHKHAPVKMSTRDWFYYKLNKNNFPLKMARASFWRYVQFVSKIFLANTPVTNEFSLFQYLNRIPHIFSVIIIFAMLLNLFPLNTSIIVFFKINEVSLNCNLLFQTLLFLIINTNFSIQITIIVVSDFKFLFFVFHCVDTIFDIKFLNIILLYLIIHKLELHWFYLNIIDYNSLQSEIITIINKSLEAFYLYCYNCYLLINVLGRYSVQSNEEW
uniref:Uncharacterized protein n=1 Tax=Heterorhabditis bacteriophora TaxID=37862 RepID=A0A1I7WKE5_HETBA